MTKSSAFTLAEVLITLAIIGVIAAISVPSLIQKTNQAELITAWKKEYAAFSQAQDKIAFDNGSLFGLCATNDHNCMRNQFANVMKVIKTCDSGTITGNCWHSSNSVQLLNGHQATLVNSLLGSGFILSDGTLFTVFNQSGNCSGSGINRCAYGHIDVNGFKKPNILGKDIHHFYVMPDGFLPPIMTGTNASYTCNGAAATNTTDDNESIRASYACTNEMLYAKN